MSSSINNQKIRQDYQKISARVHSNKFDNKLRTWIRDGKLVAEGVRDSMARAEVYTHWEECNDYIERYTKMENLMQTYMDGKIPDKDFMAKSKLLFPLAETAQGNNRVNESLNSGRVNGQASTPGRERGVSPQTVALNDFFNKKSSEITPSYNFKSVLQTPVAQTHNYRKKPNQTLQLQSLLTQNSQLKQQIHSSQLHHHPQSTQLQTQYQLNQQQLQILQKQYSKLSRDNYQLRSERSVTVSSGVGDDEDYLYSPYTFVIRRNNMYEINVRNMGGIDGGDVADQREFSQGLVQVPVVQHKPEPQKHVIYKKIQYEYDNYTEDDHAKQTNNINFSIFDINKSYLSQPQPQPSPSSSLSRSPKSPNPRTSLHNKLAFFKPKGLIIRNTDIEIGYKRSQPENNMVRVILYFNNKNAGYKVMRVEYQYQQDYYEVGVGEKLRELDGFRQGREVVEVRLRGHQPDYNSVIDVVVHVGPDVYNLWLPAMFLKFTPSTPQQSPSVLQSKSIRPLKPFQTPSQSKKTLQLLQILSSTQAQIGCESPTETGTIKLQWKLEKNKLNVTCNRKWMHLVSFLMMDG